MDLITERLKLKDVFPERAKELSEELGVEEDSIEFIRKGIIGEVKELNEKERTVVEVISTKDVDRDREVLLPDKARLDNFRKNPVVLWAHDYRGLPNGKALWIKNDKEKIVAKTKYANHQFADDVWNLKKDGFLPANSVGFIPIDYTEDEKEIEKIKKEYGIKGNPKRIYTDWELLEYSNVPVPANPQALTLMVKSVKSETLKEQLIEEGINMGIEIKDKTFLSLKSICGDRNLPINETRSWDAARAIRSVRRWASSDGSGDKDKIDTEKFKRAFAWRDDKDKENLRAYKLPFAEVINGKLTAIKRGIFSGMGAVLGARGGVDIPEPDRKRAYNFFVFYYKRMGIKPPEFREYTEEELKELFPYEEKHPNEVSISELSLEEVLEGFEKGAFSKEQVLERIGMEIAREKVGAVLNRKNKENLIKAQQLIQEVLDSAETSDEPEKGKYNCECIKCGYRLSSEKHCKELKCPKCGGQMRRVERPGPGQEGYHPQDDSKGFSSVIPIRLVSKKEKREINKDIAEKLSKK